ncbi:hypothetical protein [Peptoniphilus raoultii]|uniref:hypothetical protein n=1 Tax=Peptoniphilus raoultii TaxID=1776387 RepID=UPI0008DB0296|nr:hypothetical protein [Peptoniphilus raoultii]
MNKIILKIGKYILLKKLLKMGNERKGRKLRAKILRNPKSSAKIAYHLGKIKLRNNLLRKF